MDQQVKSQGIKAAEIQARWGIPNWTRAEDYPAKMTDLEWRWEFLRRRPGYRDLWDYYKRRGQVLLPIDGTGASWVLPAEVTAESLRLAFGMRVMYDPRVRMSDDFLSRETVFDSSYGHPHENLAWLDFDSGAREALRDPARAEQRVSELQKVAALRSAAGIIGFEFNISRPLGPQIEWARDSLLRYQERFRGKKNTFRPSRELWSVYLRVLDARDCAASWKMVANVLWGNDNDRDKARRTYESAVGVRDIFPIDLPNSARSRVVARKKA
jgi:hypothetical protein